jgi:hypothetical protein
MLTQSALCGSSKKDSMPEVSKKDGENWSGSIVLGLVACVDDPAGSSASEVSMERDA